MKVALPLVTVSGEQISFRNKIPFNSEQVSADFRSLHNENMLSAENSKITYTFLYGLMHKNVRIVSLKFTDQSLDVLFSFESFVPPIQSENNV